MEVGLDDVQVEHYDEVAEHFDAVEELGMSNSVSEVVLENF